LCIVFSVTSSENSDKEQRYRDFQLLILPYPGKKIIFNSLIEFFLQFLGCEHFREFSNQNYNANSMFYDWSLPLNDSSFEVPEHLSSRVSTDWSFWKVIFNEFHFFNSFFRSIVMEFN